jgi:cytochrome c oxidase subunit 2
MELFSLGSILDMLSLGQNEILVGGLDWIFPDSPEMISTFGHLIESLWDYITLMNVIFFGLVCIGLFGFPYIYHHTKVDKVEYTHGNRKKQLLASAAIGATIFFLVDMNITRISNNDLLNVFWKYPTKAENPIRIEVLAQQWMWNFRYAGKDGLFNTADDVLSNHTVVIEKDRKVEFRITSKDVIHSLFFPNARVKTDAIPGRITRLWFEPFKSGKFDVACAEMCGTHHYKMQGILKVLSKEDYASWEKESQELALQENDTNNLDNYWGWKWETE